MKRIPVKSGAIRAIGYDEAAQMMEIEFKNGRVYQYFEVPPEIHKTIITADSISQAFNDTTRNIYEYRRAPRDDEAPAEEDEDRPFTRQRSLDGLEEEDVAE